MFSSLVLVLASYAVLVDGAFMRYGWSFLLQSVFDYGLDRACRRCYDVGLWFVYFQ